MVCEVYTDPEPQVLSTRYIYGFRLKIPRFITVWITLLRIFVKYVVFFQLAKEEFYQRKSVETLDRRLKSNCEHSKI